MKKNPSVLIFSLLLLFSTAGFAADVDLQVSAHTWGPDPIVNNGEADFSLTIQNNGPQTSASSQLVISLPANVSYLSDSQGCSHDGVANPKTLTCNLGSLAISESKILDYTVTGGAASVALSSATITDTDGNTDINGANNSLDKLVTTIAGADLNFLSHTGPANANVGDTIDFILMVQNSGPDAATGFRVTDNLPAQVDFGSVTASGMDWSCNVNVGVPNVECDYTGAGLNTGIAAPAITVRGRVITSNGSITNGASVVSTDSQTGDPDQSNDTASNVTVLVNNATDLRANKSMTSAALGIGSVFLSGESVTLQLSATNTGLRDAAGVSISDLVPNDFTINLPLPGGCSQVGQDLTCSIGDLNAGQTSASFAIDLTAATVVASTAGSNTATVARSTPVLGNNSPATVNYSITPPFAHLEVSKTKSGGPILAGANITNTIRVMNAASSTAAASGTVTVVDTLTDYPNEEFVSVAAPWNCLNTTAINKMVTCSWVIPDVVAIGAYLPDLVITTRVAAGYTGGSLSNTVNTGLGISSHTPADNGNSSATAMVVGTPNEADLSISKLVSDNNLDTSENSLSYTLIVTNVNGDTAATVNVSDPLPMYYGGPIGTTSGNIAVTGGLAAGESCSGIVATVNCTLKNLVNGASRTLTITINRPFISGTNFTNTATVSSPDTVETNNANNSASATVNAIAAITDVSVTAIAAALDPVKAGVEEQFTVDIKNLGPNPAQGVEVEIPIDTSKVTLVPGSIQLTDLAGSCNSGQPMNDPGWGGFPPAGSGISCSGFTLDSDESRQVIFRVMPIYPYNGGANGPYTAETRISTSSFETNSGNNHDAKTVTVTNALLDLAVTKQEANGYDPDGPGPLSNQLHDPIAFGDQIIYLLTLRNNGPSLASEVRLVDTITPPGGFTAGFVSGSFAVANSSYTPANGVSCNAAGGVVTCYLGNSGGDHSDSVLPANQYVGIELTFTTSGPAPGGSLTYTNHAEVISVETAAGLDSQILNNSVTETTTVLPKTDLYLSKTISLPIVDLNQIFTYTLILGNEGASTASGVRVMDTLPSGFVMAGPLNLLPGGNVSLTTNACTAPALGNGGSVSCDLGAIPADATRNVANQVRIEIPLRAVYQSSGSYNFAFNANISNTGSVTPLPNTSIDPVTTNNSASVNVQIRKNSIAGRVYTDNNNNDLVDGGEGINQVVLSLTGTDSYGFSYGSGGDFPTLTTQTNTSGVYSFDVVPPGSWNLLETQPSSYWDRFETIGTAGGSKPANICDGTTNCASSATANNVSNINLPATTTTSASGYVFQEYRRGRIHGYVYHDDNNDGDRVLGVAGISGQAINLSGTAYNGIDVCSLVTCGIITSGAGQYSYLDLPPSDAVGYTVRQNALPAGYFDGKDQAGDGGANVIPASAGRVGAESLPARTLAPNQIVTEYNFGELLPASISGAVFLDNNNDAVKGASETSGVTGLSIQLTGSDDLGSLLNLNTTTGVNGSYSFANLRPGSYTLTQVTDLSGLTHTGAQAGSKGGTIDGIPRVPAAAVTGETVTVISAIPIASDDSATGYNFGESGQGLTGSVYVDVNNNGNRDAGEPGIPGVAITLSGTTASGANVCVEISPSPCTLTTSASGAFIYIDLPASNAVGYTLTEQPQGAAPLSNYADGLERAGTLGGTAGSDQLSGIIMAVGDMGTGYLFGEQGGSLSGRVYHDADDNGSFNAGDTGIAGVVITLAGNTNSGSDVCTVLPDCDFLSTADGSYALAGLPAGNYGLSETQPLDFVSRTNTAGSAGGIAAADIINGISLGLVENATDYLFGEKTGELSGSVYHDLNNDGDLDAGETGIASVTLTLSGITASGADICSTIPSCTTSTAADGSYSIQGLRNAGAAGYTLSESQPPGYLDGIEANGDIDGVACAVCDNATDNLISAIPFNAASTFNRFDFAELLSSSLSGVVWHDLNEDGDFDVDEPGLGQVTLTLSGNDDQGTPVNTSILTAADGSYNFDNLRPSDGSGYTITQTQPPGISDFLGASGTQTGSVGGSSTGSAALNRISNILLASGSLGIDYNFREKAARFVDGFVYLDSNDDGVKDPGEAGILGVTITLTATAGGACADGTNTCAISTASDGSFGFAGLRAGTYTLTEDHPLAYQDARETAGNQGGVVDNGSFSANPAQNQITTISLPAGADASDYLFGELQDASLAGRVWDDQNNDGVADAGENGIQNVTVTLSGTDVLGNPVNLDTSTAADGSYRFDTIFPGTYSLTESQPVGYIDGIDSLGSLAGSLANDSITNILLGPVDTGTGYNFAELRPAALRGAVFIDSNVNAVKEGDETEGVSGLSVRLTGMNDRSEPVDTTSTTTDDGTYQFSNLRPGTYSISQEISPAGLTHTGAQAGSKGGIIDGSSRTPGTGVSGEAVTSIGNISIVAADNATGYNFGKSGFGSLSGYVYHDTNNDGVKDADEAGIAEVSVTLSGTAASGVDVCSLVPDCSTVTGEDGSYAFVDLPTANTSGYTLTQTQPSDYLDGIESQGKVDGVECSSCDNSNDNVIANVPYVASGSFTHFNFAELLPASLSGLVWHDIDNNQKRDPTEPGLGLVTLNLSGRDDLGNPVKQTLQTEADGHYHFSGLRPSDASGYTIRETQPNGIDDFPGASGSLLGTIGNEARGTPGLNQIDGIVLHSGEDGADYDFREDAAILVDGLVYLDADDDGIRDAGELGIEGVSVRLNASNGGACADGTLSCTTLTDAQGNYQFAGLRAGVYSLTEEHPVIYEDGRETIGSLGGTVNNNGFSSNPEHNSIGAISLPAAAVGSGYLFAELPGIRARIAGRVWVNSDPGGSSNDFDSADTPLAGWIVELVKEGVVLASTTTGEDGSYEITSILPDYDYSVRFRNPANGQVWGFPVVNGGVGRINRNTGAIDSVTVPSNGNVIGLDLPIDPSGVVYDAETRLPVAGVTVTLSGPAELDPTIHLIGGSATQVTGEDGFYQFFLTESAPSGTYILTVSGPVEYLPGTSEIIPPCVNVLVVASEPNPALVQDGMVPPAVADPIHDPAACPATTGSGGFDTGQVSTLYYVRFELTLPTSGNVILNNIPLDPVLQDAISATKSTAKLNVIRSELVPYTLTFTNTQVTTLSDIDLKDQLPAGFKYRKGSAFLNGDDNEPVVSGRTLSWPDQTFAANETKVIKLLSVVGAGVSEGKYENQSWADNNQIDFRVSNIATATVRVVPDPLFDCSDLIGKVFDDLNANGYQDEGESGIPNVRLATVQGLLITSDDLGRFHIACAAVPNELRGSNFIIKLDERSLPSGYRITTENPRVVRLTQGKLSKVNFGATVHRVVRLDVSTTAFDQFELAPDWSDGIEQLVEQLRQQISVLRLTYWRSANETLGDARQRLRNLEAHIRARWRQEDCCYDLLIETELTSGGAR